MDTKRVASADYGDNYGLFANLELSAAGAALREALRVIWVLTVEFCLVRPANPLCGVFCCFFSRERSQAAR
jgi:hypothetical protein